MKHLYTLLLIALLAGTQSAKAQTMITVTNTTGSFLCDGTAYFNAWSSYNPATYNWSWYQDSTLISTGDTLLTDLCSGYYQFELDSAGTLVYTTSFYIGDPCSGFYASVTTTNTEPNLCTGTAVITPIGGTAPYAYSWQNGATTQNLTDLCPGTYTVTCVDANGCAATSTFNIFDGDSTAVLTNNLTVTDDYDGNCSGTATAAPQGGTPPYTIIWSNGQTGDYATGLCAGIYSVTVWDSDNDTITGSFVVADSTSTFGNNPYSDSIPVDELYGYLVENCTIVYSAIDSASLADAIYDSVTQNLYVTWEIYSANGTVTYLYDTLGLSGQPGVYTLSITVYCPSKSAEEYFKIIGGIYLNADGSLAIVEDDLAWTSPYPNPFTGTISLQNEQALNCTVTLVDAQGRRIVAFLSNETEIRIDELTALGAGTYFLNVATDKGSKTWKLVK